MKGLQAASVLVLLLATPPSALSAPARQWRLEKDSRGITLQTVDSQQEDGRTYTRYRVDSESDFQQIRLRLLQAPAKIIPDFAAEVEINSTVKGVRLALRMILPNQRDPRNEQPLITFLPGTSYERQGEWQTLRANTSADAVEAAIRSLRVELQLSDLDTSGLYVDGCVLISEVHTGEAFFDIGRTTWGPVVAPEVLATLESPTVESTDRVRAFIEREQLHIGDERIFLRLIPDHGESIALLKSLGINAVWVANAGARERIQELQSAGLVVLATPPHPQFDPGDFSSPVQGLVPLDQSYPEPALWYLGTRVGTDQLPHLLAWAREVRSADRVMRRPLVADVIASAGIASRQIDLVGQSQQSLNSRMTFGEGRNRSFVRQNASAQLSLPWEWLQTSAPQSVQAWRQRLGLPRTNPEPEQVLMEMVASLSAGTKGIGFWKTSPLKDDDDNDVELRDSIALANHYAQILEPILTQGRVESHLPVSTVPGSSRSTAKRKSVSYSEPPTEPDAAVISRGQSTVILAAHWDKHSHFVPQPMYAPQAKMTVAATETASAWQLTATGVRGLRRDRTAGGLHIRIRDFDTLAMVFVSSSPEARRDIEQRVFSNASKAAQLAVSIARRKVSRTDEFCKRIDGQVGASVDRSTTIAAAERNLATAELAIQQQEFNKAGDAAFTAMRLAREVQNGYWRRAVDSLPGPTASPYAISFATLHEHWKMMKRIQTTVPSENLVPSGDFESLRLLSERQWKPVPPQTDQIRNSVVVVNDDQDADKALRLRAWNSDAPVDHGHPVLLLQTPEVKAAKGDIFEIRFKARLGDSIVTSSSRPLLLFDSELGPELAMAPKLGPSWQSFRMLRQASLNGPFKLWLALEDVSEVYVDDYSIVRFSAPVSQTAPPRIGLQSPVFGPTPGKPSRVQGAGYSIPVNP